MNTRGIVHPIKLVYRKFASPPLLTEKNSISEIVFLDG